MVVYADVLVTLNFIVDYFLIKLTAKIAGSSYKTYRILLGSAFGGLSSLYIFLPSVNMLLDIVLKLACALLVTIITFGFKNWKAYFRSSVTFFVVSFGFAGVMLALWHIARPYGMVIKNSVVYFDISPVALIAFSVAAYFITALLRHFLSRNEKQNDTCKIEFFIGDKSVNATALIDSGNSLSDAFGMSEIIIADKKISDCLLRDMKEGERSRRYRAIPCSTVSGTEILDGYRVDRAYITASGKKSEIYRPIIAISKTKMANEIDAIINPRSV